MWIIIILECWLKFISHVWVRVGQPDSSCSYSFGQPAKWKLASVIQSVRRSVPACCLSVCKSVSNSGGLSVRQRVHQSGSQSVRRSVRQSVSDSVNLSVSQCLGHSVSRSVWPPARPPASDQPYFELRLDIRYKHYRNFACNLHHVCNPDILRVKMSLEILK